MNLRRLLLGLSVALATSVAGVAHAATHFTFEFDNQGFPGGDGPVVAPIVGTGTFTSLTDLSAGTYDLSALAGFSLNLSFVNGASFTEADIQTALTGVAVRIVDEGGTQRLFFTEGDGPGADNGPSGGAIDFSNDTGVLSFEPTYAGGNFIYFESGPGGNVEGRYVALSAAAAPEPASWAMMLGGFGLIGATIRRRRSAVSFA